MVHRSSAVKLLVTYVHEAGLAQHYMNLSAGIFFFSTNIVMIMNIT